MMSMMLPFVDVEYNRPFIDELFSDDLMRCLQAIVCVRNSVIGSNRQKGCVINQGVVPKLLQLLENAEDPKIRVEAAVVLGSLAKGTPEHAQELLALGVVPALIRVMSGPDLALAAAALRGLRSLLAHPFAVPPQLDAALATRLIALLPHSVGVQACVASVLASACATQQQQSLLVEAGALKAIHELLDSDVEAVQTPTLQWLAALVRDNPAAASAAAATGVLGILPQLADFTSRNRPPATQLAAAAAIAHLHRAGAVPHDDPRILYRALPCLVRLCKKECLPEHRAAAAECLAHLTAVDTELQRLASISDQLVPALADMLRQPDTHRLRQAAFKAFASLGANDEEIRKRIIETDNLMDHIVSGLQDSCPDVRLSAVRCLHSLSRSVQQLRTTFQDHSVWRPLMALLSNASDDVLTVASSTLCNLLLEFSPAKEPILESGAVGLLCGLTRRPDPALRLNGIWALMNMAFQAEQKIKSQILAALGTDQMFRLLSDSEVSVLMKTLGLLRNLLSTKLHIDHIMGLHGAQIMQAVVLILEGGHGPPVKEQALCILANIADGDTAKDYIMANQDVLRKLTDYMMHSNVKLQVAAIFCVSNLAWRSEPGSAERQARLRDIGVLKLLQQLVVTADTLLFDKVKTAMTQFSDQ